MTKDLWINLPVKDVKKAKEFFVRIGFVANDKHASDEMACIEVGTKKMNVLLIAEETFRGFTKSEIADTEAGAEVILSFDAESREEIDETARQVFEAGGRIFAAPSEIQGWMYGFAFADPDGHRWNMLFMDSSKMPGAEK